MRGCQASDVSLVGILLCLEGYRVYQEAEKVFTSLAYNSLMVHELHHQKPRIQLISGTKKVFIF